MTTAPARILDAHHHFWKLDGTGHYPWLQEAYDESFFLGDYTPILHTFLLEEYRSATFGFPVIGTVHVEAERDVDEEVAETQFIQSLHEIDPHFPAAAVGHASFTSPKLHEVLQQHAQSGIVRGIRAKPRTATSPSDSVRGEPNTLGDQHWISGLAALESYGFSWDLRVPYWHLTEAAEVLSDLPATTVVLNHCGLPLDRSSVGLATWRRGMEDLAALPKVMVKVSELGLPHNRWDRASNERVIAETVSIFGFERSMFASNLPVATLTAANFGEIITTVLHALPNATHDQIDQLFARTAAECYRIDLSSL
jgi:predicted TIM-barrel fold metal-dependent hydrolase